MSRTYKLVKLVQRFYDWELALIPVGITVWNLPVGKVRHLHIFGFRVATWTLLCSGA